MNKVPGAIKQPFHGYKILGLTAFTQFFAIGCAIYLFGLFVEPISQELNISRAALGFGPPITFIISSLLSPVVSQWVDRDHTRTVMIVGALCISVGLILLSMTTELWQMGLVMSLFLGTGTVMLGVMPSSSLVINWFQKRRGFALGIAGAGAPLGGVCLPPFVAYLMTEIGWRHSLLVTGIIVAVTVTPAVYFLAISKPEKIGQFPDNEEENDDAKQAMEQKAASETSTKDIVLQRNFFAITGTVGVLNFVSILILTTLVPYAIEIGLSTQMAALLFSVKASTSFAGMFLFGYLSDKIGARNALFALVICYAVGWPLLLISDPMVVIVVAVVLTGLAAGGILPIMNNLIARLFGRSAYARAYSLMRLAMLPIIISPAPLSGYVYDVFGTYMPVLTACLIAFPIALLCLIAIKTSENSKAAIASA